MIDLYSWCTPNGQKVSIMLEECSLEYRTHPVNIAKGDQFDPAFLKISPNNRIPAVVDRAGPGGRPISLFESGAILIYLADKTAKFLPAAGPRRYEVLQWLMWQMSGVGPMFGQAGHFRNYAPLMIKEPERLAYGQERYTKEARRLYGIMDERLGESEWLGTDEYSIADMATWPWVAPHARQSIDLKEHPNVARWHEVMKARPPVRRGYDVLRAERERQSAPSEKTWSTLFGDEQFKRRRRGSRGA